jgi:hypothetical protein
MPNAYVGETTKRKFDEKQQKAAKSDLLIRKKRKREGF